MRSVTGFLDSPVFVALLAGTLLPACKGVGEAVSSSPAASDQAQPAHSVVDASAPRLDDLSFAPAAGRSRFGADPEPVTFEPSPSNGVQEDEQEWLPPEPDEDGADWIKLVSGEWLRGEIKVMRDEDFEFDSDELDLQKFDWEDVVEVRSSRINTIMLEDKSTFTGTVHVKDDKFLVRREDGSVEEHEREDVMAFLPGEPRESNYWSGSVGLGFTGRSGNTDQTDLSARIFARRRTASSRAELTYDGAISTVNTSQTANNHRIAGKYDYFFTRRFFATPFLFELYSDPFSNIAFRATPGAAVGYDVLDRSGLSWSVQGGAGYRLTDFEQVQPGQPDREDTVSALFITGFEADITKRSDVTLNYSAQIGVEDVQDTNQRAEFILSIEFAWDLDIDVSFIWDRVGDPAPDANGIVPKQDDFRMTVGLAWDF